MNTLGERIRIARKEKKITQEQLAKAIGVTKSAISQLETGITSSIDGVKLLLLAEKLNKSAQWFATGVNDDPPKYQVTNAHEALITKELVPLISWVNAGVFCEIIDNYQPGVADEWLPCPSKHSTSTYALKVQGDSMTAPHGRSYPEGTIIFCDPMIEATSGCRVIAKRPNSEEATFKEYRIVDGIHYLKPLNVAYETIKIEDDTRVCAVIIGSYYPE